MSTFKITATAPTVYQLTSLRRFGMNVAEVGNGAFTSEQEFCTEREAKDYLIKRAEMYYDNYEGEVNEHINDIEKYGILRIDAVSARIDEFEDEEA